MLMLSALLLQPFAAEAEDLAYDTDRPGFDYRMVELEFKTSSFLTFERECQAL
jgi:hypothetical protein